MVDKIKGGVAEVQEVVNETRGLMEDLARKRIVVKWCRENAESTSDEALRENCRFIIEDTNKEIVEIEKTIRVNKNCATGLIVMLREDIGEDLRTLRDEDSKLMGEALGENNNNQAALIDCLAILCVLEAELKGFNALTSANESEEEKDV